MTESKKNPTLNEELAAKLEAVMLKLAAVEAQLEETKRQNSRSSISRTNADAVKLANGTTAHPRSDGWRITDVIGGEETAIGYILRTNKPGFWRLCAFDAKNTTTVPHHPPVKDLSLEELSDMLKVEVAARYKASK